MNKRPFLHAGVLLAVVAAVAGCGGVDNVAAPAGVPAGATASPEAFVQYLAALPPDDSGEPLDIDAVEPPVSDTTEPVDIN